MDVYEPIKCGNYDYLEIACMDRYEIELQLSDNKVVGRADELLTKDRQEFLVVTDAEGQSTMVRADRIKSIRVITRPARFTEFRFAD